MTKTKEFILRIFSVLVLYPAVVWSLILGKWTTLALICIAGTLSLVEWFRMTLKAETLTKSVSFLLVGNAYIFMGCFLFWFLSTELSWSMMTILLSLIFLSDIGGYVSGNLLKGPKLIPRISPNKTWSGALGAICFTLTGGYLFSMTPYYDATFLSFIPLPLFFVFISVIAQMGDILESWTKRQLNAKDSGSLIPGHGGILDRLDSVLAVTYGIFLLKVIEQFLGSAA
ncbi:MAG: phosphatidate cytidylyltransferase [Alphaproteobacteria bacterium]|nr:phosphatidate cytidylyltransferase [Alphaproteobacteria bacterium]